MRHLRLIPKPRYITKQLNFALIVSSLTILIYLVFIVGILIC